MIDLHCDTLYSLWAKNSSETLIHNAQSVDSFKLQEGNVAAQCFAMFVPMHDSVPQIHEGKTPWQIVLELHQRFQLELAGSPMKQALSVEDILQNKSNGIVSAILTVEEGGAIEGRLDRLQLLKAMGVMIYSLTWNYENELAYPNSLDAKTMASGLKPLGFDSLDVMGELGIAIDVSHLSDGGFWDVVDWSKKQHVPFMATHSNARSITAESRNLSDEMLVALAACGGVAGLNLCPAFLLPTETGTQLAQTAFGDMGHTAKRASRIEDMVRHILHMRRVGGIDVVAIGTDFDGIGGNLEIPTSAQLPLLKEALLHAGLHESEVDKIWETNAMRVLRDVQGL